MMSFRYLLMLSVLGPCAAQAQISYVLQQTTTLSTGPEWVTIQQPTTGGRMVEFKSAYVECSVACTVTLERNGSRATGITPKTPQPVNPREGAAVAVGFVASNVGQGSVLQVSTVQAGGYVVFDLTGMNLKPNAGNGENFTVKTSDITGVVNITINWTERTN